MLHNLFRALAPGLMNLGHQLLGGTHPGRPAPSEPTADGEVRAVHPSDMSRFLNQYPGAVGAREFIDYLRNKGKHELAESITIRALQAVSDYPGHIIMLT